MQNPVAKVKRVQSCRNTLYTITDDELVHGMVHGALSDGGAINGIINKGFQAGALTESPAVNRIHCAGYGQIG